jgi:DNA-binding transcriptional LysR family regulator
MHISDIELRHLRYFVAVAEELSFGKAADRIGIAQPPLSQQIQRLERSLGFALFERRPRVQLTEAGAALLTVARRVLAQVEKGLEDVQVAARGEVGTLLIGFVSSALLGPLPEIVRAYRERFPAVKLDLRGLSTAEQLSMLRDGVIGVGLLRDPNVDGSLRCDVVFKEPFAVILPPNHHLSGQGEVDLSELASEPFVLFARDVAESRHEQIVALCRRSGFTPRVAMEAAEWLTIVGLVDAGLGVSIVPTSFGKLRWGGVEYRPITGEAPSTSVAVCYRPNGLTPAAANFVRMARHLSDRYPSG